MTVQYCGIRQSEMYRSEDDIERFEDVYGRSNNLDAGVKTQTLAR